MANDPEDNFINGSCCDSEEWYGEWLERTSLSIVPLSSNVSFSKAGVVSLLTENWNQYF